MRILQVLPTAYICSMGNIFSVLIAISLQVMVVGQVIFDHPDFFQQMDLIYSGEKGLPLKNLGPNTKIASLNLAWWNILNGHESAKNQEVIFKAYEDFALEKIKPESWDNRSLFIRASAALFAIRTEALLGNKYSGARKYLKALPILKELLRRSEEADELKLLAGLYHFGMPEFSRKHKYLLPLFWAFPDADEGIGKRFLLQCLDSPSPYVRTEARYFLFKFYKDLFEESEVARLHLGYLVQQFPENAIFKNEWALLNATVN
jgi:hypothetical protein